MGAGRTVEDILAGAKETLSHANALSDSVEKEKQKAAPTPAPHLEPAPKHENSSAPYSMAKEARDTGSAIKNRMKMAADAQK